MDENQNEKIESLVDENVSNVVPESNVSQSPTMVSSAPVVESLVEETSAVESLVPETNSVLPKTGPVVQEVGNVSPAVEPQVQESVPAAPVVETPTPVAVSPVQGNETAVTPVENVTSESNSNVNNSKKGNNKMIIIVVVVLLLVAACAYVYFCTDLIKGEKKEEEKIEEKQDDDSGKIASGLVEKFEGIYSAENDKLYIHKVNDKTIKYVLGGNFQGTAEVDGDKTAIEKDSFGDGHFEFVLADDGIEVEYISQDEDTSVAVDTGLYTRVADYSKDNVYKEAVGDPQYLTNSNYSGLYKSDDVEMYVIQTSENKVIVTLGNNNFELVSFNEVFEIESENKLVAKSFFDENEIAYEIQFADKSFTLTCNENVFGFDEEDKQLELTYSYAEELTKDKILNEFYSNY